MGLAVVDVDGVVADVRHRLHHLDPPKSWAAFFAAAGDDPLLPAGAQLVADLHRQHEVVWLTGRPHRLRPVTERWLRAHDLPCRELHMRPEGDRRSARLFKLGVLSRLLPRAIDVFVDDDPDVVQAARAAGVPTVLADWVPRGTRLHAAQEHDGRT
jgi:phosphoglycolate phosphatase-like HAD superfamily hydrolase